MSNPSSPLFELTKTRLREFWREPGVVFWVFAFPLLMAVGLGLAFRSRPPALPEVAIVQPESSELDTASLRKEQRDRVTHRLLNSDKLHARVLPNREAQLALSRARVDVLVQVEPSGITYRFDETQEKSPLARLAVDQVVQEALGRHDAVQVRENKEQTAGSRYIDFLLPGLIGLNLMGSSMWGVGYNLVVARKRRLLRRYAVTPMKRSHFLLSYFFARAFLLTFEFVFLLSFGALIFQSIPKGSLLLLLFLSLLGAASFGGISLLIGARVQNTESANGWMNLVQLPMWVLSGAFFSYERFPEWLHLPIELLPLTALVNSLRSVYLDGSSLPELWSPILVMGLWGGIGYLLALKTFRWQ